ncbi:class I SAM-dependent methyltransferase [Stackebrandtia soli]|uniref:class I SAM-dependent methyltransferase n=1 Tax=Stackebrandtia soli TaxID=1892856 RepID=UPI0039EBBCC7
MRSALDHDGARTRWPDVLTPPRPSWRTAVTRPLLNRVARRFGIVVTDADRADSARHPEGTPVLVLVRPLDFLRRLGTGGLIGLGESYQAGDWTSPDLAALLTRLAENTDVLVPPALQRLRRVVLPGTPDDTRNTLEGARRNIAHHYDLSNELFRCFLDDSLTYSAALFSPGREPGWRDLADAQRRKIDRLLDAVRVRPGSRVLEIGTGWGELAIRAAQRGATVETITLSREQRELARRRVDERGLGDAVRVHLRDYRELELRAEFDAVISVEMIEAVGDRYWAEYFQRLNGLIRDGGRVGLQAITMRHDRMVATRNTHTWIQKYIFPGGLIPSVEAIDGLSAANGLRLADRLDFGLDYARTLRLWRDRFDQNAADVARLGFDEVFHRTWRFYLAYSEAGFRSRYLNVHQFVLRKD